MAFKNINNSSTTEMVIEQIKNEIITDQLKAGEKLPSERRLAELLGVSRTAIREAIQALSYSGYLDVKQGKGAYVTENAKTYDEVSNLLSTISDYSLTSLMEVREMLEGEIVRLATLRATAEEIQQIDQAYKSMKEIDDIRGFVREDLKFHLSIAKATHNPLMNTLMKVFGQMLHKETNKIVEQSIKTRNHTLRVTEELVEAIKNRDEVKSKSLMTDHIRIINQAIDLSDKEVN